MQIKRSLYPRTCFLIWIYTTARVDNNTVENRAQCANKRSLYPRTCSLYLAGACDAPVVRPAVVSVMALLVDKVQKKGGGKKR